jgi:hypothetical protein
MPNVRHTAGDHFAVRYFPRISINPDLQIRDVNAGRFRLHAELTFDHLLLAQRLTAELAKRLQSAAEQVEVIAVRFSQDMDSGRGELMMDIDMVVNALDLKEKVKSRHHVCLAKAVSTDAYTPAEVDPEAEAACCQAKLKAACQETSDTLEASATLLRALAT